MFKDFIAGTIITAITMALVITAACNNKSTEETKPVVTNDEDVMTIAPTDATPVAVMDATPVITNDATNVGPSSKDASPIM